jgi:hypothetical protein
MFSILGRNVGRSLNYHAVQSKSVNSVRQYSSYSFANQQTLAKCKPIYQGVIIASALIGSSIGFREGLLIPGNDVATCVGNIVFLTIYGGCYGFLYGVFSPVSIPATIGVLIKMGINKKK